MKFILTSIGTRGDMEPFMAIGEILAKHHHEVVFLFPKQFESLIDKSTYSFESLGSEFIEMLESETGKYALGGGGNFFSKTLAFIKLAKVQARNNKKMTQRQYDVIQKIKPDYVIHNGKAMYPVIWEVDNPQKTVYVSPVPYLHYVKGHSHLAFRSNFGDSLNRLTYKLADWGIYKTIISSMKSIGIKNISKRDIKKAINNHKIIYTISPQLFERPNYWHSNMHVLGYHERDKVSSWTAPSELNTFLEKNPNPIFISFGSMTNPNPKEKTAIIMRVLTKLGIPAVINTSSGGLQEPSMYDKTQFYFTQNIPYDWIFKKVKAVIHHGGSGTTHTGLKYGRPTLIIPHIIDQYIWNNIIAEKKLGPKGIKISRINERKLYYLIEDLIKNEIYRINAKEISQKMIDEKHLESDIYDTIIS